ncbi:MAG: hypothetical protein JNM66_11885 [Bryobacterales bacterium]|nr:hypothetical protein [Bryobacterales bacterium]
MIPLHQPGSPSQPIIDGIRRPDMFYEVYPDLALQGEDAPSNWFELALYAELNEWRPPDHPEVREAFAALMDIAGLLVERIQAHAPYSLEFVDSFHLLPGAAPAQRIPRVARTVSLLFSNAGPCSPRQEPPILAQLREELRRLHIPRLERLSDEGIQ